MIPARVPKPHRPGRPAHQSIPKPKTDHVSPGDNPSVLLSTASSARGAPAARSSLRLLEIKTRSPSGEILYMTALLDSGADANFIGEEWAMKTGLSMNGYAGDSFRQGSNDLLRPLGQIFMNFNTATDYGNFEETFLVVKGFQYNAVLGHPFITEYEVLTRNPNFLILTLEESSEASSQESDNVRKRQEAIRVQDLDDVDSSIDLEISQATRSLTNQGQQRRQDSQDSQGSTLYSSSSLESKGFWRGAAGAAAYGQPSSSSGSAYTQADDGYLAQDEQGYVDPAAVAAGTSGWSGWILDPERQKYYRYNSITRSYEWYDDGTGGY